MTVHSNAFIDLDCTFSKIPLNADLSDDVDLSGRHQSRGELHWIDLFNHHRVILVSEAGSGQTAEIQNVTRQLRSAGKNAFFLRIQNVCPDLEDAIEEGIFEEFKSWLDSGTEGWLFMDSVDEARLKDPRDFERAIRKLGCLTKSSGAQAHILITGRSTACALVPIYLSAKQLSSLRQKLVELFPYKDVFPRVANSTSFGATFILMSWMTAKHTVFNRENQEDPLWPRKPTTRSISPASLWSQSAAPSPRSVPRVRRLLDGRP